MCYHNDDHTHKVLHKQKLLSEKVWIFELQHIHKTQQNAIVVVGQYLSEVIVFLFSLLSQAFTKNWWSFTGALWRGKIYGSYKKALLYECHLPVNCLTYNMRIPGWKRTHGKWARAGEPKLEWQLAMGSILDPVSIQEQRRKPHLLKHIGHHWTNCLQFVWHEHCGGWR